MDTSYLNENSVMNAIKINLLSFIFCYCIIYLHILFFPYKMCYEALK